MEYHGVHNPQRARQLILFENVSKDGVGMTDVDGLIEYRDRALILFEVKLIGKEVPVGQRIALERLVSNAAQLKKIAIAVVVEHDVEDPEKPVFIRYCRVREIYWGNEKAWRKPRRCITAGELADAVIGMAKI